MSNQITCTFTLDTWQDTPVDDRDGVCVGRVHIDKTFSGELTGHSTVEMLTLQTPVPDSRAYVAFERIVGSLNGRAGSFVLQHSATASAGASSASWSIVPDSGTHELRGLRGQAQITVGPDGGHSLTLEYELD